MVVKCQMLVIALNLVSFYCTTASMGQDSHQDNSEVLVSQNSDLPHLIYLTNLRITVLHSIILSVQTLPWRSRLPHQQTIRLPHHQTLKQADSHTSRLPHQQTLTTADPLPYQWWEQFELFVLQCWVCLSIS